MENNLSETELLKDNSNLTRQIYELVKENDKLRAELANSKTSAALLKTAQQDGMGF